MPRKARIDAQGTVQHVIIRGIERRNIFRDKAEAMIPIGLSAEWLDCWT